MLWYVLFVQVSLNCLTYFKLLGEGVFTFSPCLALSLLDFLFELSSLCFDLLESWKHVNMKVLLIDKIMRSIWVSSYKIILGSFFVSPNRPNLHNYLKCFNIVLLATSTFKRGKSKTYLCWFSNSFIQDFFYCILRIYFVF